MMPVLLLTFIITSRRQICEVFSDLLHLSMSLTDDNCLPFIWRFFRKFVRFASKRQYIENSLPAHKTVQGILWMWMFWNLKVPTLPYHTSLFSRELKTNENVRFPLEINRRISIFLPYACCQGGDWFKWGKKFTDRQASRKSVKDKM